MIFINKAYNGIIRQIIYCIAPYAAIYMLSTYTQAHRLTFISDLTGKKNTWHIKFLTKRGDFVDNISMYLSVNVLIS